jgi:hypothetical protein
LLKMIPRVLELIESKEKPIYWIDEAVFSCNQTQAEVWWPRGEEPPSKIVNALRFEAVAVVAAIDSEGHIVHSLIKEYSIKKEDF